MINTHWWQSIVEGPQWHMIVQMGSLPLMTFKHSGRVIVMRTDNHQLLMDRHYLLEVGEMYQWVLKEKETEVD
jgi:hypothetical protein